MQKRVMRKWMLCCMIVPMNASQISEYTDSFIAKAGLNVLPYNNFVAPQQKSIAPIFADDDSIWHQESVDVIATLGIVSGDDNDHFMPSGGLTRQAAAKMIYNLSTNSNIEEIPPVTLSPFSDVSTDSRFAGYILWCLDSGIISGYSDGTFRPTNGLTQDAFLKMLLCSLGYNQVTEGYVGENWRLHVEEQSINAEFDLADAAGGGINMLPIIILGIVAVVVVLVIVILVVSSRNKKKQQEMQADEQMSEASQSGTDNDPAPTSETGKNENVETSEDIKTEENE